MRRVHLTASGDVQGVFFRASARDRARRLGVTGWVRNAPDGSVVAEAQGDDAAVEDFVAFCRDNPGQSTVTDLRVEELPPADDEPSFDVR